MSKSEKVENPLLILGKITSRIFLRENLLPYKHFLERIKEELEEDN